MPHLKCVPCRTRYYTPGEAADPIEDLCPACGRAFEPAGELSELLGFRAATAGHASGRQQGLVDRLDALLTRRAREQARGWERDSVGTRAQAAAVPCPKANR